MLHFAAREATGEVHSPLGTAFLRPGFDVAASVRGYRDIRPSSSAGQRASTAGPVTHRSCSVWEHGDQNVSLWLAVAYSAPRSLAEGHRQTLQNSPPSSCKLDQDLMPCSCPQGFPSARPVSGTQGTSEHRPAVLQGEGTGTPSTLPVCIVVPRAPARLAASK